MRAPQGDLLSGAPVASNTVEAATPNAPYRAHGAYRLLLALVVLFGHAVTYRIYVLTDEGALAIYAHVAVLNFFVLSGFIIAEVIDTFYADRPGAFLLNRGLRLLPPYWAAVALAVCIYLLLRHLPAVEGLIPPSALSVESLLVQVTTIIPIFNVNKLLPPQDWFLFVAFSWAILHEFVFYLAVAIAIALWRIARRFVSLRTFALSIVCACLAAHVIHYYVHPIHAYLSYAPQFVLGMATYALFRRPDVPSGLIAAVCYLLVFLQFLADAAPWGFAWYEAFDARVLPGTMLLLAGPLLTVALASVRLSPRWVRIDRQMGDLAYPVYLNHGAVFLVVSVLVPVTGRFESALATLAVATLTLAVAYLMKLAVETPLRALRDRIRGRPLFVPPHQHAGMAPLPAVQSQHKV